MDCKSILINLEFIPSVIGRYQEKHDLTQALKESHLLWCGEESRGVTGAVEAGDPLLGDCTSHMRGDDGLTVGRG